MRHLATGIRAKVFFPRVMDRQGKLPLRFRGHIYLIDAEQKSGAGEPEENSNGTIAQCIVNLYATIALKKNKIG